MHTMTLVEIIVCLNYTIRERWPDFVEWLSTFVTWFSMILLNIGEHMHWNAKVD